MSETTGLEKNLLSFSKSGYREIITKAICGTSKKFFRYSQQFPVGEGKPDQILGTSITQVRLKEPEIEPGDQMGIRVNGTFESHIWYSYNNGKSTDLIRQSIHFEEVIPVNEYDGQILSITNARATLVKPPQALNTAITGEGKIKVDFELGIYVEVIGETKVFVKVASYEDN